MTFVQVCPAIYVQNRNGDRNASVKAASKEQGWRQMKHAPSVKREKVGIQDRPTWSIDQLSPWTHDQGSEG
jgi:hypothetical protein